MIIITSTSIFKRIYLIFILFMIPMCLFSFPNDSVSLVNIVDTVYSFNDSSIRGIPLFKRNQIYRFNAGYEHGTYFHTNKFLKGDNKEGRHYNGYNSLNFGLSFQIPENTLTGKIYGSPYQGIGISKYLFGHNNELGNPFAVYLFQGANIHKYTEKSKLTYEWNFGISYNWIPYDDYRNQYNKVIGSKLNAYINAGIFMNWLMADGLWLKLGPTVSHFSNGNTKYPNAGLNIIGVRASVFYDVNNKQIENDKTIVIPHFLPHFDYNVLFFGSWRRGIVVKDDNKFTSGGPYGVGGISFSTLYNLNYKYCIGASADLVYDGSLSTYIKDETDENGGTLFGQGPFMKNIALGISARGEYIMPYFTIGLGLGYNIIDSGRDSKGTYQLVSLKHFISNSMFLNVGYKLKDFKNPNYLMLGVGFGFR